MRNSKNKVGKNPQLRYEVIRHHEREEKGGAEKKKRICEPSGRDHKVRGTEVYYDATMTSQKKPSRETKVQGERDKNQYIEREFHLNNARESRNSKNTGRSKASRQQ